MATLNIFEGRPRSNETLFGSDDSDSEAPPLNMNGMQDDLPSTTSGGGSDESDSVHSSARGSRRSNAKRRRAETTGKRKRQRNTSPSSAQMRGRRAFDEAAEACGMEDVSIDGEKDKEEIQNDWQGEAFEDDIITGIEEDAGVEDDPEYCFFCKCAVTRAEEQRYPQYTQFINFFVYNYEMMQRREIALASREIYNAQLRPVTDEQKAMAVETFVLHFEEHNPHPRVVMIKQLRFLLKSGRVNRTKVRERNKTTKEERLNPKNLSTQFNIDDRVTVLLDKLQKSKPAVPF